MLQFDTHCFFAHTCVHLSESRGPCPPLTNGSGFAYSQLIHAITKWLTLHVIMIPEGSKCGEKKSRHPPGAAENEIDRFWCMEIIAMFITKFEFSGRTSRSVNIFQLSDCGLRWGFHPPGQTSRKDESTPWGRFVNFTLRGLLWHVE
jgi:hypothetical protein